MKRRLKEIFRVQQTVIPGHYDIWFVMRAPFGRTNADAALESFTTLLAGYLSRGAGSPMGNGIQ